MENGIPRSFLARGTVGSQSWSILLAGVTQKKYPFDTNLLNFFNFQIRVPAIVAGA